MRELFEQLEQLSDVLSTTDTADLAALADAHTRLEAFARSISSLPPESAAALASATGLSLTARKSIEDIILNDARDAQAELSRLTETLNDIRSVIECASNTRARSPAHSAPIQLNTDDLPLIIEFAAEAASHLEHAEQDLLKLEAGSDDPEIVGSLFRRFHTIKGVAGFLNLEVIQSLAHNTESLLDLLRAGSIQINVAGEWVLESIDIMKELIAAMSAAASAGGKFTPVAGAGELIERLGEFVVRCDAESSKLPEASISAPGETEQRDANVTLSPSSANTIKVPADRLNSLIRLAEELAAAADGSVEQVRQLSLELKDVALSLRLSPIDAVFRKISRLVRDLSRKMAKEVELVFTGGSIELDSRLIELLGDPLVHMVRNSIDHGIEPPEERMSLGKPARGRIAVSVLRVEDEIHIAMTDDGRGLCRERILRKAIEQGVVPADAPLSDGEIDRLIFAPGLSTADRITDISGRGVGMDVVRENIERLGGHIDISSTPGTGTTFTIRLPLTLAVIDGAIVRGEGHCTSWSI